MYEYQLTYFRAMTESLFRKYVEKYIGKPENPEPSKEERKTLIEKL